LCAPQKVTLLFGSMHWFWQSCWPRTHVMAQTPVVQTRPEGQACPALIPRQLPVAPQKLGSLCGLMQVPVRPGHWRVGGAQLTAQVPLAQTVPAVQTLPAVPASATPQPAVAPQKLGLVVGSTHVACPLTVQRTRFFAQVAWQVPTEQISPPPQVVPAVPASPTPHPGVAPQKVLLLVGSTQAPLQATCPGGQLMAHTPPPHA
jgi:hypothetical protein